MSFLGLIYGDAWGVPEDLTESLHWLQSAAAAGHPLARYNLGVAYDNGIGLPRNRVKAWLQFRALADTGYRDAQYSVAHMLFEGEGVGQNYRQARLWARRAARLGHAEAMQLLGNCQLRGLGGAFQLRAAQRWLQRAASAGSAVALQRMQESWLHPQNSVSPKTRFYYLKGLIDTAESRSIQTEALYALGCLVFQHSYLLPTHHSDAKDYFRWATQFQHMGAALRLAQLEGEQF